MRAHTFFRDLDRWASGNFFLTHMQLLKDTLVPGVEYLSDTITVVWRPFKVGNMRTFGQHWAQMTTSSYMAPSWELIVMSSPYLGNAWDYLQRLHRGHVRSWTEALEGRRDVGGSRWAGAELSGRGPISVADRPWGWLGCPSCSEDFFCVVAFACSHKTVLLACNATP